MRKYLFLIFLLIPSAAFPVVQVTNFYTDDGGLLEDGEAVTIKGIDFGQGPHVTLFEDFETTGDGGATPPSGTTPGSVINTAANIGSWSSTDGGWNDATGVKYDSNHISGSYSGRMYDPGVGHNQARLSFSGTQEIYLSFWFLWPTGTKEHGASEVNCMPYALYSPPTDSPGGTACSNINYCDYASNITNQSIWKFVWIYDGTHGGSGGDDDDIIIGMKNGANIFTNDGNEFRTTSSAIFDYIYDSNNTNGDPNRCWYRHGTWVRMSTWVASRDNDFTGLVDYYFQALPRNGSMYTKGPMTKDTLSDGICIGCDPPQEFNSLTVIGWMRTKPTTNCRLVFDDFYLATGPNANARVEVCDSSTYTNSSACFIAPTKSWNSTTITANVDQGDFTASTYYLFVTNASNNRNTVGYPITFDTDYDPPVVTDDPVVSITVTDSSLTESDGSTATFSVDCDEFSAGDCTSLSVDYTASGTATEGTDYAALSGSVTITDKDTPASISIDPTADSAVDSSPEETIIITLDDGAAYDLDPINYSATSYLTDEDVEYVNITATDDAANEETQATGAFDVCRSGTTDDLDVTVRFGGTAGLGDYSEYSSVDTTVTIPDGEDCIDQLVTPIADSVAEGSETVTLTVIAGSGYNVGTTSPTDTVTISESDKAYFGTGDLYGLNSYADYTGSLEDTFNNSGDVLSNYSEEVYLENYVWSGSANNMIIKGNFTAIPEAATINSAYLYLYLYDYQMTGGDANLITTIHRITRPGEPVIDELNWQEYKSGSDWTNKNGGLSDIAASSYTVSIDKTLGWKKIPITSLIQNWIDGTYDNYGMLLATNQEGNINSNDTNRIYYSSDFADNEALRPVIAIDYTVEPGTGTAEITGGGTGSITGGGTGIITGE
jgi:hypothetical protein